MYRSYRRISTILSQDLSFGCCFSHSAVHTVHGQSPSFPYTEEVLASYLAPLLQQKDSSGSQSLLRHNQQIHAQITVNGLHKMGILGARILGIYLLSHKYFDAKKLFFQLQLSYAAPWNWMIRGFTLMGYFDFAILFYFKMLCFGTSPDNYTFPCVIKACGGLHAVDLVKYIHGMIKDLGFELDVYVGSALVKFYAENDCLDIARSLFDILPQRDIVLWNVMLNGYLRYEILMDNVIVLFKEMRQDEVEANSVTYACLLCFCASKSWMRLGIQIHGLVVRCGLEMDSPVANTLISMYTKSRCLLDARKLFDLIGQAHVVAWNGMIGGYVQHGLMNAAFDLFQRMMPAEVKPDSITFASLLPSIPELGCFDKGKEIHCYIIRHGVLQDLFLSNALIDMYFKCKDMDMACKVFDECPSIDAVICTTMISGFVLNGMNVDALEIFRWLILTKLRPTAVTLASILPACASLAAITLGKELHAKIIRMGHEEKCYVGSAITDTYAKCGRLDLAEQVFNRISERDSICWNTMITNYSQNGKPESTIDLFRCMGTEGAKHDCVSLSAALSACANLSTLHHGKELHGFVIKGSFHFDLFVNSALIDMYAKCGNLESAQRVFDTMDYKNEVSWNSIIAACGNHGHLKECLELYHEMENEGYQPDHVTFVAILSACGHAGQVEEGKHYFNLMNQEYRIAPRMEHFACLIDLFGRAGRLEEAFRVIEGMPFTPDAGIWGTLLGACRVHGNVELAELASEHLINLDPENSGYYVLLSNLHANSGKWERANQIRNIMKERGVQKIPGYSWIEVNNSHYMFAAADKSHPLSSEIYVVLNNLLVELQNEGYVPQPSSSTRSVPSPLTIQ